MDAEEPTPRTNEALNALLRQDLDPLSVAECEERIVALQGEIARTRARIDRTVNTRASADTIFRR